MTDTNWAFASNGATIAGTNYGTGVGTALDISWCINGGVPRYDGDDTHAYYGPTADNVVITFVGAKTISSVVIWSNNSTSMVSDPAEDDAGNFFAPYIYTISTWNGASWDVQDSQAFVSYLKHTSTFAVPVSTTKIKFEWSDGNILIQEIEAWASGETLTGAGAAAGSGSAQGLPSSVAGAASGTGAANGFCGSGVGAAAGIASAGAVGLTAAQREGTSAGRCLVTGMSVTPKSKNWMRAPYADSSARARWGDALTIQYTLPPYFWGSDAAQLIDGDRTSAGTPWVASNGTSQLVLALGVAQLVDKVTIWSSSKNPEDQMAYPTFELSDHGFRGSTDDRFAVFVTPNSDDNWQEVVAARVTGNRNTKLEIEIPQQMVAGVLICGLSATTTYVGLESGTIIQEIEVSQNYTLYENIETSAAAASNAAIAAHVIKAESTADVSATVDAKGYAVLTDGGHATSAAPISWTEQAVAAATGGTLAAARTLLQETLVDGGVASDAVVSKRTLALESSGALAASLSGKLTHTEVSTGEAVDSIQGDNSITQSEESTGVATDTVIGIRRVTVIEESGGTTQADSAPGARAELAQVSTGIATAVVVQRSVQTETLESTGYAEETLPAPFQGSFPIFWTNSISAGAATWNGLPFNSFIEADGVVYAAGPVGIFELGDDLDDLDTEVLSEIEWDLADHGSVQMQRMRSVYVKARTSAPFTVRVANEQGVFNYPTTAADTESLTNHRAPIGRGVISRNARISLLHTKAFTAESAGVGILPATRRI